MRTWRTDGQTPANSKDRANESSAILDPLALATRGKNNVNFCTRTIIPGYGIIPKRIWLNMVLS